MDFLKKGPDTTEKNNKMTTKELLVGLLKDLNCEYADDEDDPNIVHFSFQGGNFLADTRRSNGLTQICYNFFYSEPLDDLDRVSRLRNAINQVNTYYYGMTMFYSIDHENNVMWAHNAVYPLFSPMVPKLKEYLMFWLNTLLTGHKCLNDTISDLMKKEERTDIV